MKIFRRLINPFFAFIGIQLVWILVVVGWIYWFMGSHRRLRALAEKYRPELLTNGVDWLILVEGLILLVAILAGVYVIFLFWNRQASLYRAQRQFIAQVTHELKSPLASLQLHLETIRRRRPAPEKMEIFLDTMLADTERLDGLINNLLSANRLEQRSTHLTLKSCNFSDFVSGYFRRQQFSLPRSGSMELSVEDGLWCRIEAEAMETVFRNLLENAILYSTDAPRIRIVLHREGETAHLRIADQGRGIEKKEQKKVFKMFYRVRHPGETIRGSGLGLFIIRTIVRMHRGHIWVESAGLNQGTTFHICLPLSHSGAQEEPA